MRRKSFTLFLTIFLLAGFLLTGLILSGAAQADFNWQDSHGPGNGDAPSLAYDAVHNILYRGTSTRGVWKYQGGVWTNIGQSGYWGEISSLAYDSTHNILYVGISAYGVMSCPHPDTSPSWGLVGTGLSSYDIGSLAYDSTNNVLYAGTFGAGNSGYGVWKFPNPNNSLYSSWTNTGGGLSSYAIDSLAYDSTNNVLYAGTGSNGVWSCTSPNTSPSWSNTNGGVSSYEINSLAYDSANNILYAGTGSNGVWSCTSLNTSPSWSNTNGGVSSYEINSLAYDSTNNVLYVGATGSDGVWSCTNPNTSPSWADTRGGASNYQVQALAYDSTNNVLYAGTDGVWSCANPNTTPSWTNTNWGMSSYADSLAYDSTHNVLYAGTFTHGVWSCTNPDTSPSWTNTGGGLSSYTIESLAYDTAHNVLYAGTTGNGVWSCTNPNTSPSWTNTGGGVSNYWVQSLAYDSTHNVLYAGCYDTSTYTGQGVWSCANPNTSPSWTNTGGGVSSYIIYSLACDTTHNVLYAGTYDHGVCSCTNPNTAPSWTNTGGILSNIDVVSLAYDSNHNVLYAGAHGQGVYCCTNPNTSPSWTSTGGGMTTYSIYSIACDLTHNVLYAGADDYGVRYAILPATPTITSIDPTSGLVGSSVTVNGSNFGSTKGSSTVTFNGTVASVSSWADGVIQATVPSGATTGPVVVTTLGGASNNDQTFTVNNPVPTTTSLFPVSKTAGQPAFNLTVNGTNFVSGLSVVRWNGSDRTTTYISATQLTAAIPASDMASAGTADVTVFNPTPGGGESNSQTFTINPVPVPTTTTISPTSKVAGQPAFTLTVNGTNFVSGLSKVQWNGTDRTTTYVSGTHLTATIPASDITSVGTADVTVYNPAPGGTSNSQTFTIDPVPVPTTTSLSPTSKTAGQPAFTLTVNGTKFVAGSKVRWNGSDRTTTYVSPTQLKAAIPASDIASAGTASVTVFNPGGGTSNAQTFTVTAPQYTPIWYLAEGTSDWGFDTYVTIENPNTTQVTAQVTYMTKAGAKTRPDIKLPAMSQTVINPRDDLGAMDFSTKVECKEGKTIAVDRRMIWTGSGSPSQEGHSSIGVTSPAQTWYLAEGSSKWGFECWLLIQNPNATTATCAVTYMIEGLGPKSFTKTVKANSRASFFMADDIGSADASIKVSSNVPVIPERAVYRNNRREGHDSIGTTAPAKNFYLAEGTTDWGFTTYVLVQNPNDQPNTVTMTYMTPAGAVPQAPFTMQPNSRKTVKVNDSLPGKDLSTHVQGTLPLIAERAMYWGAGTPLGEACHDSIGMASPHTTFCLPDGETDNGYETWTLVQNPNSVDVQIQVSYLKPSGQNNVVFTDTVKANSRKTYNMADRIPSGRAAVLVTSQTPGKGIMVERSMYWNNRGAGTDTIGGYSD